LEHIFINLILPEILNVNFYFGRLFGIIKFQR